MGMPAFSKECHLCHLPPRKGSRKIKTLTLLSLSLSLSPSLSLSVVQGLDALSRGNTSILPPAWSTSGSLHLPCGPLASKVPARFVVNCWSSHGIMWEFLILFYTPQKPSHSYGSSPEEVCFMRPKLKIKYSLKSISLTLF